MLVKLVRYVASIRYSLAVHTRAPFFGSLFNAWITIFGVLRRPDLRVLRIFLLADRVLLLRLKRALATHSIEKHSAVATAMEAPYKNVLEVLLCKMEVTGYVSKAYIPLYEMQSLRDVVRPSP